MAEPAMVMIPWLDDFERDPAEAVDDLLRGVADVTPYERAGAADVLVTLFSGLAEDHPRRHALDEAIGNWLVVRRADGPSVRREYGINRYVEELIQALTVVYRLRLTGTADRLRTSFTFFQSWLQTLALGPGQDPALELWRVMALLQTDRRFLKDWYRLCEEAGQSLAESYLTVGLLGLRRLPEHDGNAVEPGGRLGAEVVAGLFRWAARLPQGPANRKAFQRHIATLRALYPRAPQRWRDLIQPLIAVHTGAPFLDWLEGVAVKLGRGNQSFLVPPLPPRRRLVELLGRLRKEPMWRLLPEIWALVREYESYAEATGNAEFVVKTACNFSSRLRRSATREALRLARLAHRWQPSNSETWNHWAAALEALGDKVRAEAVYWEAVRRFPEDDVPRNALADLLVRTGRSDEAERLLRETVDRFPKDTYSRNVLAGLLTRTNRTAEAEGLLRETIDRFPKNEVPRNALADLLARIGRSDEAEGLLRETVDSFPEDPYSRNALAGLLVRTDRTAEAESLLREIIDWFPEDDVARNILADLLARTERPDQAECLYRETMAHFPRSSVAYCALSFWLLRWDRFTEAEELYWQIHAHFPENHYTHRLAEEIARLQGGWRGEIEVPDFSAWKPPGEALEGEPVSEGSVESEAREAKEPPLGRAIVAEDRGEKSSGVVERLAVPWTVAEPAVVYDVSESEGPSFEADLDSRLLINAEVSRADFRLRSAKNQTVRQEALSQVEKILEADPDHVYPRLVLGLHETVWRQRLVEEVEAFNNAYPLRFLAARESGTGKHWDRLLRDFGEHYPWTILGRVVAGNGDADPADAARLATWALGGNGSREGFAAFTAMRLEHWLGESPRETEPTELLRRLVAHRKEVDVLIGDALRRAADEKS